MAAQGGLQRFLVAVPVSVNCSIKSLVQRAPLGCQESLWDSLLPLLLCWSLLHPFLSSVIFSVRYEHKTFKEKLAKLPCRD